ncbi:MAG TPA: ABC transporter substrate-binding protein [Bdellovibrionales bacterium]|jgi:NitT/TauT family transport system substrate-binding protein|nr:ABC transporter substrate-binding protein [Bdellovibrionales bacterium]
MLKLALVTVALAFSSLAHAEKIQLALNWKPEPQFGGFYAAESAFKKNKLDVEVLQGGSGTPVVQMVGADKVPFGIASADEVVIARSNGSDVVAIFAAYQTNPQGIMAHAERGFKSIGDVYDSEGVLAIQKGLPYAMFLSKKYPKSKATIVPYAGGIQNFLTDKTFSQQCFVTSEPLSAQKQGVKVKAFLIAEEGYNPYTTVLITREKTLKDNPELVKQMVAAVREGWRTYLDKPEPTNKMMAKLNPSMDLKTFAESAEAQKPLIETAETKTSGLGSMTKERWQQLTKQLADLKLIKKAPAVDSLFLNP